MKKAFMALVVLTVLAGPVLPSLAADDYPARPIRMIVPFPPGGGNDLLARSISNPLSQAIGQQVIVDNRGGAGGQIGATLAAAAAPDGYTIFLGSIGNLTFLPVLQAKLQYDPLRDFAPVTLLATSPFILVINPGVPAKSVKELIALAKAQPGKLNYGSAGPGSSLHMTGELFKLESGADITHIPYKGTAPALVDLLSGQVQMLFSTMPSVVPHVKTGKLRALGPSGRHRLGFLLDVPTIPESGIPEFDWTVWIGVFAPAGTPAAIVTRLNRELVAIAQTPEAREKFSHIGVDPVGSSPEEFAQTIKHDVAMWSGLIRKLGLDPKN